MFESVKKVGRFASRLVVAVNALSGKFDDEFAAFEALNRRDQRLRQALEIEVRQTRYWQEQWFAAGRGHSQAQQIMSQEIDALVRLSHAMVEEIDELREKVGFPEGGMNWRDRISKYRGGDYMEMVEKYRESFVNTRHPEGVRSPGEPAPPID